MDGVAEECLALGIAKHTHDQRNTKISHHVSFENLSVWKFFIVFIFKCFSSVTILAVPYARGKPSRTQQTDAIDKFADTTETDPIGLGLTLFVVRLS